MFINSVLSTDDGSAPKTSAGHSLHIPSPVSSSFTIERLVRCLEVLPVKKSLNSMPFLAASLNFFELFSFNISCVKVGHVISHSVFSTRSLCITCLCVPRHVIGVIGNGFSDFRPSTVLSKLIRHVFGTVNGTLLPDSIASRSSFLSSSPWFRNLRISGNNDGFVLPSHSFCRSFNRSL